MPGSDRSGDDRPVLGCQPKLVQPDVCQSYPSLMTNEPDGVTLGIESIESK